MTPFKSRLPVIYVFLAAVATFSCEDIWSLQTNSFASYLGGGLWFYFALDVAAIATSAMAALALRRRAKTGPRLVVFIACAALVAYLGSKVLLLFLLKGIPFYSIVGIKATVVCVFAVSAIILVRTKEFVNGYASRL